MREHARTSRELGERGLSSTRTRRTVKRAAHTRVIRQDALVRIQNVRTRSDARSNERARFENNAAWTVRGQPLRATADGVERPLNPRKKTRPAGYESE